MMSFHGLKQTPEMQTSLSPRTRPQIRQQRFVHPSDPTINTIPFPQSSKNANAKHYPPTLFHSNFQVQEQTHTQQSRSPQSGNGKENQVARRQSYKPIAPSSQNAFIPVDTQSQWVKDRITMLEKQINGFLHENKQLTRVLDQQIQINQQLKDQLKVKTSEAQNLEKIQNNYSMADDKELKSIMDQLQVYKQIVESLEVKINNVIGENGRLNEYVEHTQMDNDALKQQLLAKCQHSENDDTLELKIENAMLRQNSDSMEQEISEMRSHIEIFKQHIINIKGTLTPQRYWLFRISSCDRQVQIELDEKNKEIQRYFTENLAFKQQIQQKDSSIRYLEQILSLDAQKLKNIEEKLSILEKENQILKARLN